MGVGPDADGGESQRSAQKDPAQAGPSGGDFLGWLWLPVHRFPAIGAFLLLIQCGLQQFRHARSVARRVPKTKFKHLKDLPNALASAISALPLFGRAAWSAS